MRVCLITGEYPPMQGGVGDYTHELARAMARQGADVVVLTSRHAGARRDAEDVLPGSLTVQPVVGRWDWRCWGVIRRVARELCPDVLHVQYQSAAYGLHPAINLLPYYLRLDHSSPRIAVTFHDLRVPYVFPKAGPLRWWSVVALARGSDVTIVTNAEDHRALSSHSFGERIQVIPIGSNISVAPPPGFERVAWRGRWGYGADDIVLCYFGFLNESKGGESLVRALGMLAEERGNVYLLMIGGKVGSSDPENRAYLERVQALIADLGLGERVQWTGFTSQAEVSANFMVSDICVLPYRDGVSFRRGSFMAALAHGLPIVTTQPGLPPVGLVDGESVVLAAVENVEALAEAIARLIEAPHLRERLADGARQLSQRFGWEHIARRTLEAYSACISR